MEAKLYSVTVTGETWSGHIVTETRRAGGYSAEDAARRSGLLSGLRTARIVSADVIG